ncbi:hypothetical protein CHS0354_023393 [Potamilus streckersoni]|uniref:Sushi domain-containing protein n=1 Tax=Potamilus streckersoni TaxID=2493646 RepID=A0AAE0T5W1_9BIVA|nr:hypothetical protein CHS0354_023393 [Potamilus streckersoni]
MMTNPIPLILLFPQIPSHPVWLQPSSFLYGDFFGFHGAENSHILLILFMVLVMYVTYLNSKGSGGTGTGPGTNGGAGNGNGGKDKVVIEPRVETCGPPPTFTGWIFESSTGSGPGNTATYHCMTGNECFIVDVSTCQTNGAWSTLSTCEKVDC